MELLRCSAQISLFVPIPFNYPFDSGDQNKASNVELALIVEKRVLEVFLDYEGAIGTV